MQRKIYTQLPMYFLLNTLTSELISYPPHLKATGMTQLLHKGVLITLGLWTLKHGNW